MRSVKPAVAICLALLLGTCLVGCGQDSARDSKVYQGVCLSMSTDGKSLTLANSQPQLNPVKGASATFELARARVGLHPEKGDTIRVAYFQKGDRLVAIKVMNLTKQDLRKKN